MAAERQDPDFLIGPRNKKARKKDSAVKILLPPFQITTYKLTFLTKKIIARLCKINK
jgi:hypothetical protein